MILLIVESNEQSELTSKIKTDSEIESRLTAINEGGLRDGGVKLKGKTTHGHGQQCGDCGGGGGFKRYKK